MTQDDMELLEELEHDINVYAAQDGCIAKVTHNGVIVKKFKGETAHSDALRFGLDLSFEKNMETNNA